MPVVGSGPYTTIAGLILDRLGRIPDAPGARVAVEGWTLEVTAMDRHAITGVRAVPAQRTGTTSPGAPADAGPEENDRG